MNDEPYISVRTKHGKLNHKALRRPLLITPQATLCGYAVAYTRVGGSWFPEHPRHWDDAQTCHRCERYSGEGNL